MVKMNKKNRKLLYDSYGRPISPNWKASIRLPRNFLKKAVNSPEETLVHITPSGNTIVSRRVTGKEVGGIPFDSIEFLLNPND